MERRKREPAGASAGSNRSADPDRANPTALRPRTTAAEPRPIIKEKADEELAGFFAQSRDLLCIAGFDGYFKRLNSTWTTRLGWTLEELQASPFIDFVHHDDRARTLAELESVVDGAETILFENRYRHRDGSYRRLQWNAHPVPGRQRVYAMARDITRQRRLEREVVRIVDRERKRLGFELHDGLCQNLAGIAALSSTLSKRLSAQSAPAAAAAASEIHRLLNEAIGLARDLARGFGPVGLQRAGLAAALEALALKVQSLHRVTCRIEQDPDFPALPVEVETHLFRITQEALANAVAHGRPDHIEIQLTCRNGEGRLIVRDDGGGVREDTGNPDGIGLHTMDYRARLIGASLDVRRRSRKGTAVTCTLALPENSATP